MSIKIFIVEDDPITCMDLYEILEAHGYDVMGTASSYLTCLSKLADTLPDVMLIDVKLKGEKDGLDLISFLTKKHDQSIPSIFLTANTDKETLERAFESGPAAFLTKPYSEEDMLIALKMVYCSSRKDEKFSDQPMDKINEILFIKNEGTYSRVVTEGKEFMFSEVSAEYKSLLPGELFTDMNDTHFVNLRRISRIDGDTIYLNNHKVNVSAEHLHKIRK